MDVVSPELNNLLPDEIMDTEAIVMEEVPVSAGQPCDVAGPVPMETDVPTVNVVAVPTPIASTGSQLSLIISSAASSSSSSSSSVLAFKPLLATATSTRTTASLSGASILTSSIGGLQKLSPGSFAISAANHQTILNKVAEANKTAGAGTSTAQVIKQDGQKLLVTTIGKSGQPIVLQLPPKSVLGQAPGDGKSVLAPQYKVVTIGGRTELQAQQLKTLQVGGVVVPFS